MMLYMNECELVGLALHCPGLCTLLGLDFVVTANRGSNNKVSLQVKQQQKPALDPLVNGHKS